MHRQRLSDKDGWRIFQATANVNNNNFFSPPNSFSPSFQQKQIRLFLFLSFFSSFYFYSCILLNCWHLHNFGFSSFVVATKQTISEETCRKLYALRQSLTLKIWQKFCPSLIRKSRTISSDRSWRIASDQSSITIPEKDSSIQIRLQVNVAYNLSFRCWWLSSP